MIFDRLLLDDLLKKADISSIISRYIPLSKKGKNFVALCPFHDDKNPSLSISPEKQIFKCFVCGTGGSAIQFVQNYEKISFPQAVKKVAEWSGFDDPRLKHNDQVIQRDEKLEPYYLCLQDLLSYYHFGLASDEGAIARQYLTQRGLDSATIDYFKIGYALQDGLTTIQYLTKRGHHRSIIESLGLTTSSQLQSDRLAGRVIFPIHNKDGRVIGFSGRILNEDSQQAKYVNSSDSPIFNKGQNLYNYHQIKLVSKRVGFVYLMEGFMDVIALHRANIPQAIALMGTAITSTHIKLLQQLGVEIRVSLDQDAAGQAAMMKLMVPLTKANVAFKYVISEKETRDVDEILLTEGIEGLKRFLDGLVSKMDFSFHFYQHVMPLSTTEERVGFIDKILPLIATMPDLEQIDYLKRLGQLTQFAVKDLQKSLTLIQKKEENYFQTYRPETLVLNRLKRAEKAILFNMFINPLAIELFQKEVKFFHDDIFRQIAIYLLEVYQNDPPDHQTLINHISLTQPKDQHQIINTIASLMTEKNLPKADKEQLLDYLNTLKEEREKLIQEHHIQASIAGKPDLEQARIIKEFHKQTQQKNQKGEDNETKQEKSDEKNNR